MTHVMVKCNACHGTHTAAEVGKVKPNLTGYTASSGITGYRVPKDRCLTCHGATLNDRKHPRNPAECLSCHGPHDFTPPNR
jgi:nitrate reductase cytochrome c-type subunit